MKAENRVKGTVQTPEPRAIRGDHRPKVGIFDHTSLGLGGGQLVVARMAAQLSEAYEVDVIHSGQGYTLSGLAKAFELDLTGVKERIRKDTGESFSQPLRTYLQKGFRSDRELTRPYDLFIYTGHGVPPFLYARRGMVYCHFPLEGTPSQHLQTDERWQKRYLIDRWLRLALYQRFWEHRIRRYETVLANSHFTSGWIKRLWGREAEVLYPPIDVQVPPVEKRNIIVSVGSFMSSDLKGHAQQLKAFPEFLSTVGGSWSLCMIGFCCDIAEDRAYLAELQQMAKDLPVTFVVNADRKTVLKNLAEAKLFWHTTGIREQECTRPWLMEHFGIATVEAMMTGCVPLVPAYGGQPEIVEHEVNGFLCKDLDALIRYSVSLAGDDRLCAQMSRRSLELSGKFCPTLFEQRFRQLVFESVGRGDARSVGRCNLSSLSGVTKSAENLSTSI